MTPNNSVHANPDAESGSVTLFRSAKDAMKTILLVLLVLLLIDTGCTKTPETLILSDGYNQKEMNAAIARARGEVNDFIAVLAAKNADSFSVKVQVSDSHGTEHFWIIDVRYENGVFIGQIGNEPGVVRNVSAGQEWRVKKEDISDWMFERSEKIHGGYTIDPLLASWDKDKADALRRKLVR